MVNGLQTNDSIGIVIIISRLQRVTNIFFEDLIIYNVDASSCIDDDLNTVRNECNILNCLFNSLRNSCDNDTKHSDSGTYMSSTYSFL